MLHVTVLLFAASLASARAPASKPLCGAKELARRDCRLIEGAYNLRLLDKTVAWNDGTWHTVDPMPLSGEGIEWEKIRFDILAGRPVVQMWLWDKPGGEAQVQSLHWYVADAEKRKFTILAEGIVRKRHLKQGLPPPEPGPNAPPAPAKKGVVPKAPPRPKFLYDALETHTLKPLKDGRLEWTLGRDKKILEKVEHGI